MLPPTRRGVPVSAAISIYILGAKEGSSVTCGPDSYSGSSCAGATPRRRAPAHAPTLRESRSVSVDICTAGLAAPHSDRKGHRFSVQREQRRHTAKAKRVGLSANLRKYFCITSQRSTLVISALVSGWRTSSFACTSQPARSGSKKKHVAHGTSSSQRAVSAPVTKTFVLCRSPSWSSCSGPIFSHRHRPSCPCPHDVTVCRPRFMRFPKFQRRFATFWSSK